MQHPQDRNLAQRPHGIEVEEQGSLQCGEPELVRAQRAVQWMAAQSLDEVGAPDEDPRLRPAEPASDACTVGSSDRSISAPEPRSSSSGMSCLRAAAASSASDGCSVKPTTRKFD